MAFGRPYRPPCSGWRPRWAVGCQEPHERTSYDAGTFAPHPQGWPKYENTTQVTDPCDSVVKDPFEVPFGNGGCPNFTVNPFSGQANTYALKSPPEFVDHSHCRHVGFKVLYAMKAWHGQRAFTEPCPEDDGLSQTKYLTAHRVCQFTDTVPTSSSSSSTSVEDFEFKATVGRYTGQRIIQICDNWGPPVFGGLTHCGTNPDAGWSGWIFVLFGCEPTGYDVLALLNSSATTHTCVDAGLAYDWSVLAKEVSDTQIHVKIQSDFHIDGDSTILETQTWEITATLSDPYTAADVVADGNALKREWNLSDDVEYPWRTDVPQFNDGPPAFWEPQQGASYGPLVTYQEDPPTTPDGDGTCSGVTDPGDIRPTVVLGQPIWKKLGLPGPGDFEHWWDFDRINYEYQDSGGGVDCWNPVSFGKASPFVNATQWTPDWWNNVFPTGSIAAYNSPRFSPLMCTTSSTTPFQGYYITSDYAEVYLFDFPSHKYARPCGPDDRQAVDPDYTDCTPDGFGGYVRWPLQWPRDARWPNAGTPTTSIPNSNQGSDASCYCRHPQAESAGTNPHPCGSDASPDSIEAVLAPKDAGAVNTHTKDLYGLDDTGVKGDASLKTWLWRQLKFDQAFDADPGTTIIDLDTFDCAMICFRPNYCTAPAIFITSQPPTGKYGDGVCVQAPTVALRDERSQQDGEAKLVQLDQAMVDFLWKRPKIDCDEINGGQPDLTAVAPIEENRDCADGWCDDYVTYVDAGNLQKPRCEPNYSLAPWTLPEP